VTPVIVASASPLTVTTAYLVGREAFESLALETNAAASGDSMMVWPAPAPWIVTSLPLIVSCSRWYRRFGRH
jgi:hypothetical protein